MRVSLPDGLLIRCIAFAIFASPFSLHAQGVSPMKPGLWETQTSSTNKTALPPEVEARLAAMPPAQQAQVRSMMSGGAGGASGPVVTTNKSCVAAQTSMDSLLNQEQNRPGVKCTFSNRVQTANGASFDTSCTTPQGTATGHSSFHMIDDEHATGTTHMTIDMTSNGHAMHSTMDSTFTAKYLGADCGDVKPYPSGAK